MRGETSSGSGPPREFRPPRREEREPETVMTLGRRTGGTVRPPGLTCDFVDLDVAGT